LKLKLFIDAIASSIKEYWNIGILEYWNDVKEKKTKILLHPTFHHSNIPIFQL